MSAHMGRAADADRLLPRAVAAVLGGRAREASSRPWASITFAGRHHRMLIEVPGAGADALAAAALGEHEFAIPGHIVASVAVVARTVDGASALLQVEVTTVEDA